MCVQQGTSLSCLNPIFSQRVYLFTAPEDQWPNRSQEAEALDSMGIKWSLFPTTQHRGIRYKGHKLVSHCRATSLLLLSKIPMAHAVGMLNCVNRVNPLSVIVHVRSRVRVGWVLGGATTSCVRAILSSWADHVNVIYILRFSYGIWVTVRDGLIQNIIHIKHSLGLALKAKQHFSRNHEGLGWNTSHDWCTWSQQTDTFRNLPTSSKGWQRRLLLQCLQFLEEICNAPGQKIQSVSDTLKWLKYHEANLFLF